MNEKIRVSPQALWVIYHTFLPRNPVEEERMCDLNLETEEDILRIVGMVKRCTLDCFDDSGITLCRESFAYYIFFHLDMVLEGIDSLIDLPYSLPDDMKFLLVRTWELLFDRCFPTSLDSSDYYIEVMDFYEVSKLYVKPLRPPDP